jgi:putative hemolysin
LDSGDATRIIVLLILLILSAFFSSAETCITTVTALRAKALADDGVKNASTLLKLKKNMSKMLTAILIGNNVVNLSASSLTTTFVISLAERQGTPSNQSLFTGIGTGILTFLILVFGEICPKQIANVKAEKLALYYARPVYFITQLLWPISFILNKISRFLLFILRIDLDDKPQITESELRTFVDVSHKEGVIEKEEREMITNVVDFGDLVASDVMQPVKDVQFCDADFNYDQLKDCYRVEKFTRMPVITEGQDDIIGIINLKDVFFFEGDKETFNVRSIMRHPFFTYEYKKLSELFIEMKRSHNQMAIVLDEYGSTSGILTLEDLLEEIVGDIKDEYDANEESDITKVSDKEYVVLGTARLDDIHEKIGIDIETDEYDSISGHVINLFGRFPKEGETIADKYAEYTVLVCANNHIDKVRIHLLDLKEEESGDDKGSENKTS